MHHIYRTIGISESKILQKLKKINFPKSTKLDIIRLPNNTVDILVTKITKIELLDSIESTFDQHIYSKDDSNLEKVVATYLLKTKKTIAVAESCSGGFLAHLLTNIPGSSKYFECSVTAYSNHCKMAVLNVSENTILTHGAVSSKCAKEMAKGMRILAKTDIALSTTGISGPTGATPKKPLGLLFVGYDDGMINRSKRIVYQSERIEHKKFAAYFAMQLLWQLLICKKREDASQ